MDKFCEPTPKDTVMARNPAPATAHASINISDERSYAARRRPHESASLLAAAEARQNAVDEIAPPNPGVAPLEAFVVLAVAAVACSTTSAAEQSLPSMTPGILKGLWRQTTTALLFAPVALIEITCRRPKREASAVSAAAAGAAPPSALHVALALAVATVGYAWQSDCCLIALRYASTASVIALVNSTPLWLVLMAIAARRPPPVAVLAGAAVAGVGVLLCLAAGDDSGGGASDVLFGCLVAALGGVGGACYMTAAARLRPLGVGVGTLTAVVNAGAALSSLGAALVAPAFLLEGIAPLVEPLAVDVMSGGLGWLAGVCIGPSLFVSLVVDGLGNVGLVLSMQHFGPLCVSLVLLMEPIW